MLKVEGLSTGYGRVKVVHGISLEVAAGSMVAVLGHNGAGKTTLLRGVMGLLPARRGSVHLAGADITKARTNKRVRAGLAYVPQGQQAFGYLTTRENLQLVADMHGAAGGQRLKEALDLFPALTELLGRRAGLLSGGQRQQLAIARALITGPKVMVLDEPTEGIQPSVVAEIQTAIGTMMRETGIGVLIVEQQVGFALEAASHYLVMASGKAIAQGEAGAGASDGVRAAMAL
ncbi:MAG: ATP-binding cassette domain-containing protein [Bifidobacteriaceae bacterium]|jgi:urea transport system ATP-binding protein|nr:ATP-binding cassette domain-containing protein [Bifidobacteriaceae bacterium]